MELYFAPMEGITGARYRQAHRACFGGVDRYYLPFLSPTRDHLFTPRELRQVSPEVNAGLNAVPQLLTREPADFLWAARALGEMGYGEVNLNLGCPSGTVVAKGKGAGLLADPPALERLLEGIFSGDLGGVRVSVKTRMGMADPEEFGPLLELLGLFPISLLIVHPRVREDYYRHPLRRAEFLALLPRLGLPWCWNGGVTDRESYDRAAALPGVRGVMVGQGLLADPALARKLRGGPPAGRDELRRFHDLLYRGYLADFGSQRNTVFHMKEVWRYLSRLFDGGEKLFKQIKKAQDAPAYEGAVDRIFGELPLRDWADWTGPAKL